MFRVLSGRNSPAGRQRSLAGVLGFLALAFLLPAGGGWGEEAPPPTPAQPVEGSAVSGDPAPLSASGDPAWASEEFDDFDDFDLDFELDGPVISDPMEPVNRQMLKLNRLLDRFVLDPITVGYRFLIPEPGRRSVYRFFTNINSTQSLANDIFQLEWQDAQRTFVRLVINSTVGIGGLFDPATAWGLDGHVSDFGQTLALAGVSTGPYVVLPLFGPSDARDAIGLGVDSIFHPTFFILPGVDALFFNTSSGFSERESHYEELKALEESSIDYYSALRSGFIQSREAQVWSRREDRRPPSAR